jgi:endoglucanase
MEASGNGPLNMEEWQKWTDCMEAEKISWVNWSLSDKDETCSMLLPRAKATGRWTEDGVIKAYGQHVKDNLLKYNR